MSGEHALALALAAIALRRGVFGPGEIALTGMRAFGSATLLYLVVEELLVRAQEAVDETPLVPAFLWAS